MADETGQTLPTHLTDEPELCANCAIRHSSLCGALSSEEITSLNSIAGRTKLQTGQTYIFEGDETHSFANVTHGVAKLVRGAEDGRSQIVGLLFPSDFLGGTLGGARTHIARHSIEAVSDMELCTFPKSRFEELLHDFPALEYKLLNRTMSELEIAREWMVLLGRKTAEERVATFLLHVSEKMKNVTCRGKTSLSYDFRWFCAKVGP
ncbi:MAG: Crp/Fnr family transcriptional regulator [Litoreibacter sp.]|nr:Crp/Fnr family transcriptional regulator [Litoreibacter sp.]